MKFPVIWHEHNLKNRKDYVEKLENEKISLELKIERNKKENDVLENQIIRAKSEGKKEFDDVKYNIKRK